MSKEGKQDAFDYWKHKMGNAGADGHHSSDEELSGSGFIEEEEEVEFEEVEEEESYEQSHELANDEDFQLSMSLKKSQGKRTEASSVTPAQERMLKLQEEMKREEREAQIRALIESEMAKVNSMIKDDSGSESEDSKQLSKTPNQIGNKIVSKNSFETKSKTAESQQKKDAFKQYMKKQGKEVSSDSEVSDDPIEQETETPATNFNQQQIGNATQSSQITATMGSGLVNQNDQEEAEPSGYIPMKVKTKPKKKIEPPPPEFYEEENISEDDFPEDEVDDDVQIVYEEEEEEFSVHDADHSTFKAEQGSTVNMGSVVPQVKQQPFQANKQKKPQNDEMREIEEVLECIKPQYSPKEPSPKQRPVSAIQPKPTGNRLASAANKDLAQEKVMARNNNYTSPQVVQNNQSSANQNKRIQRQPNNATERAKAYANNLSKCNQDSTQQKLPRSRSNDRDIEVEVVNEKQQRLQQKRQNESSASRAKSYAQTLTKCQPMKTATLPKPFERESPNEPVTQSLRPNSGLPSIEKQPKSASQKAKDYAKSLSQCKQVADQLQTRMKQAQEKGQRNFDDDLEDFIPTENQPPVQKQRPHTSKPRQSEPLKPNYSQVAPKPKNPPVPSHVVKKPPPVNKVEQQEEPQLESVKHNKQGITNLVFNNQPTFKAQQTTDLTNDLAKNKRFQAIKKLKEEQDKKRLGVIDNLKKIGLIENKEQKMSETARKLQEAKQKAVTLEKIQNKSNVKRKSVAASEKRNKDIESNFEFGNGELLGGDQHLPPKSDFDNFGDDLLSGDQGAAIVGADPSGKDLEDEAFPDSQDEDNQDAEAFLNEEIKKETKAETAKNSNGSKEANSQGWQGNGLGSGKFQSQKEKDEAAISRKNINISQQPNKKEKQAPVSKSLPWGFNGTVKKQTEINQEELERKQREAKERFEALQIEKADKAARANPQLGAFMQQMKEVDSKASKEAKKENMNNRVKNFAINEVNPLMYQNTGADRVPEHAKTVNDIENQTKEARDLTNQLKQLFLENKTTQRNIAGAEKKRRTAEIQRDTLMKEKNLQRVNGMLVAQLEIPSRIERIIRSADIPDYDKIVQRDNPLDSVVKKFESKGYTPEQAFMDFDADCDEVLTVQEIKDGLKKQQIDLLDTEWGELVKQMDKNGDGVLTLEEWQECLQPRIDAQKQFVQIMKGLDIDDPIILEEQILDLLFRKRRLEKEIKVMKRTNGALNVSKQKKVREEQKTVADKIKDLERQVKDQAYRQEEERMTFEQRMKAGLQTQEDIELELFRLRENHDQMHNAYTQQKEEINRAVFSFDQRYSILSEMIVIARMDRDQKQAQLKRMAAKLNAQKEYESMLDQELQNLLGRAINKADLESMQGIDLKILNKIKGADDNKIESFQQVIGALYVQRIWRGYLARKKAKQMQSELRLNKDKKAKLEKRRLENKRLNAVLSIQQNWRNFQRRKSEALRLQQLNAMRRCKENEEKIEASEQIKRNIAARKIAKAWKNRKPYLGLKGNSPVKNPFAGKFKVARSSGTIGIITFDEWAQCATCDTRIGMRICQACDDVVLCNECFKTLHLHGHRKRHTYLRIVYKLSDDQNKDQSKNKFDTLPLRDTFASQKENVGFNSQKDEDCFEREKISTQKKQVSFA